jgi:hypothetical protein
LHEDLLPANGARQPSERVLPAQAEDGGPANPYMSPAQVFDPGSSFTSRIRWPTILGQPPPSVALPREPQANDRPRAGRRQVAYAAPRSTDFAAARKARFVLMLVASV